MRKVLCFAMFAGFAMTSQAQAQQFGRPQPRFSTKPNLTVRRIPPEAKQYQRDANKLNATCLDLQRTNNKYRQEARRLASLANREFRTRAQYKRLESQNIQLAQRYQQLVTICRNQQRQLRQTSSQLTQKPNLLPTAKRRIDNTQRDFQRKLREALQKRNALGNLTRSTMAQIQRELRKPRGHIPSSPLPPARPPTSPKRGGFGQPKPRDAFRQVKLENFSISRLNINAPSSYQNRIKSLLRGKESAFRQCYVAELSKIKQAQSASFSLAFQIRQDGRVTSNRVVRWPSESFRAAICMRDVINNFTFPLPPNSTTLIEMDIFVRTTR